MTDLSLVDLGFLVTETSQSPKHVAGLLVFQRPEGANKTYVQNVYKTMLGFDAPSEPFNQTVRLTLGKRPSWQTASDFDITQHVLFHKAKPKAISVAAVNTLVAQLHEPQMDRNKPLWELHIIDGISGGKFALYCKVHHAYADGITLTKWLTRSLSGTPDNCAVNAFWAIPSTSQAATEKTSRPIKRNRINSFKNTVRAVAGLSKISMQWGLEKINLTNNAIAVPFNASHSAPLTGQVSGGRQIATARVPMERINTIRKLTHSSLNHVALTCVDEALHRYLKDQAKMEEPDVITIQMPVSLRAHDDESGGNKLGIVLVDLADKNANLYERLRDIGFALKNVRYQIDNFPATSIMAYTILVNMGAQMAESLGLSDKVPPLGHTLVSNVPGPKKSLYLCGSALVEMYPISVLSPGNCLNISLFSYAGNLYFGLVATNGLKHLESLGQHLETASQQLEDFIKRPQ